MRVAFNTILFLYIVILPHSIYMIIDLGYNNLYLATLFLALLIVILKLELNLFSHSKPLLAFTFLIFTCSLIVYVYKGGVSQYLVFFGPFFSLIAYNFICKYKIDLRWFNIVFIFFYIYFYLIYFSKLPDLFYRPGFDEDTIVFERASSNGISMALNMTLYAYIILDRYFKQNRKKNLLIIGLINIVLILIQQSRIGIACSLILLLIIIYTYYRQYFKTSGIISVLIFSYTAIKTQILLVFSESIGLDVDIQDGVRVELVLNFFEYVWNKGFFFGPPLNFDYGDATYTFNVFLDFWNNYSFFAFAVLISIILLRYINREKYYFPFYYFAPFFLYSMFESIFFPNYWDVIIYLLLFVKEKPKFLNYKVQHKVKS